MPAFTRRIALVSCLISLFVTLGASALPAQAGAEPLLVGPTEVSSGQVVTYTTNGKCDNDRTRTRVLVTSGDETADDGSPLTVLDAKPEGGFVTVSFEAPIVSEETRIRLLMACPYNGALVAYDITVTIEGPPPAAAPVVVFSDLVFKQDPVLLRAATSASGSRPCDGGKIVAESLVVGPGSGRWEREPKFTVSMNGSIPLMNVLDVGVPVFDGVDDRSTTLLAELVCQTPTERIIYSGNVTVLNQEAPATNSTTIPVDSNVRRAVSVTPSRVRVGEPVTIANTSDSRCTGLIGIEAFAGIQASDQSRISVETLTGSQSGDGWKPTAAGDWVISMEFAEGFVAPDSTRQITLTFICVRPGQSILFRYQPAAFTVAGTEVTVPSSPVTTAGSNTPVSGSPTGAERDQAPDSPGNSATTPSGFGIPTGQTVDAGGNQILPRAYLDGDTQQLIELSTGNVIGEYDPISGQFIDPATGDVTGIVDPATGELIDAATGIQIGQSTRPEGSTDGVSALGLGDDAGDIDATSSDDGGSNILVIVLAAVAGALLVAVVALTISRRKKPNLPPPPAV